MITDHNTKSGVIGGTLFSALMALTWHDILFTAIMATIGAIVSFVVSVVLKFLFEWLKTRFKK